MKTIDLAARPTSEDKAGGASQAVEQIIRALGGKNAHAIDTAIERIGRVLDNRFTLLRHLPTGRAGDPEVMLLAGPTGLWLLHISSLRGIFRATETQWEIMESGQKNFRPARPNILEWLLAAVQRLGEDLSTLNPDIPQPETAILFIDPGAHIDTVRPAVRLVPADAIERFAAGVLQNPLMYDPNALARITDYLTGADRPQDEPASEAAFADLEGRLPVDAQPETPSRLGQEPEVIQRIAQKAAFKPRQWIILTALLVINFIILIAAILFVLITLQ